MPFFTYTKFDEIPSTNTWAKEHIGSFDKGSFQVISAKRQSDGKGRQGRSFISLEGGLYLTCAFEVPEDKDLSTLAIALGASVADFLDVSFKWPNDLVFEGKKLGGFLIEAKELWWIVGLGINVYGSDLGKKAHSSLDVSTVFLSEIHKDKGAFFKEGAIDELEKKIAHIIYETKEAFFEKGLSPFMPVIEKRLSHKKGDKISIRIGKGEKKPAIFQGLSEQGELLISQVFPEGKQGEKKESPIERLSQAEIIE